MDMPNTLPQTITIKDLEDKYCAGSEKSLINYSFYIGATENNLDEIMNADPAKVCGIKLFMGPQQVNAFENENALKELSEGTDMPVAAHCEDEQNNKKEC